MFWDFWKNITDCWVWIPKIPSGRMLRRSWSCFTVSPLELSFSVFIEKIFYIFLEDCNCSLFRLVFCGCWKRVEIDHFSELGTDSFSVKFFDFFSARFGVGLGAYFLC